MLGKYIVAVSSEYCRGWEGNNVQIFENTKGFKTLFEWFLDGKDDEERADYIKWREDGSDCHLIQYIVNDDYISIEDDEYNIEFTSINDLQELVMER
tara:strand:- start:939 stop:1229 length:291 start_codon:yes stop_codon:yes gene_type:complete